jgi:putative transposase
MERIKPGHPQQNGRHERPHEALDMKCPAAVYQPPSRPYQGLPDLDYPFHDKTIVVSNCGRICLGREKD